MGTFDRTSYRRPSRILAESSHSQFRVDCLFIYRFRMIVFAHSSSPCCCAARTRTEVSRNNDKAARFYVLHAIVNSISLRISAAPERVVLCHSVMFIVLTEEFLPCTTQRDVTSAKLCCVRCQRGC